MAKIEYEPIGYFRCPQNQPSDSPRQGVLAEEAQGYIELETQYAGDALRDLDGFSHIWIVYAFHKNDSWKPVVLPPRGGQKKRGVFATRSPYRPNNIGMSAVELEKIEGRRIYCLKHDLLDETPVLDIKPYLSYSDSIKGSKSGWTEETQEYEVRFSQKALDKARWITEKLGKSLVDIVSNQLIYDPTDTQKKRVKKMDQGFCLSYRTWRFDFTIVDREIEVTDLRSGYTAEEIMSENDPYLDKGIHQEFLNKFE